MKAKLTLLALCMLLAGCGEEPAAPVAELVLTGGTVLTMDAQDTRAEAVAVTGGEIIAVGSSDALAAHIGDTTQVIDLAGKALVPGFIDAHGHFEIASDKLANMVDLNGPPIGDVPDIVTLLARLEARAAETDSDTVVVGVGYDDTMLVEARHPTRRDLDQVSTDLPVVILHISLHMAVLNSHALELAGITDDTENPVGGEIVRDESGAATGLLKETAFWAALAKIMPPVNDEERIAVLELGARDYLSRGMTTAQVGLGNEDTLRQLLEADARGRLPIRVVFWPGVVLADKIAAGKGPAVPADGHIKLGAVKIIADGSIQGYTGYLREPYHVPPGNDPDYRGYPTMPVEQLIDTITRFHEAGWQVAVHGNGDAAIDDILLGFDAAQRAAPRKDMRHVIIHAQTARTDQLDRMKALGVMPSFFELHTFYWGDRHREVFLGPERADRISPLATAKRKGVRFTVHADAPVVPMEPMKLVWAAVNRRTSGGDILGPAERVDVLTALRATTLDAAFQQFDERRLGSIEVGKRADLVVLSRNPLGVLPEELDQIEILATILDGDVVFEKQK